MTLIKMRGKNLGIWIMVVQGTWLMIRSYSYHLKRRMGDLTPLETITRHRSKENGWTQLASAQNCNK